MSKVLLGIFTPPLFEPSLSSRRQHNHKESYSLFESPESQFVKTPNDRFGRDIPNSNSSIADSRRPSTYDMSDNMINDEYQRRQSLGQRTSREQLPPLSSIFQTSRTTTLPVRTPYSERSPSFAADSPHTVLQTITSTRQDGQQDQSYDRRNPVRTAPSSYNFGGRSDRPELPHSSGNHSSNSLSGSIPQSFDSRYGSIDKSRVLPDTGHQWSPRASELSSSDYFSRTSKNGTSTDKVYSDSRHQLPPATSSTRYINPEPSYKQRGHVTPPPLTQYQLTSASNQPEPSSSKDSLGPKIWTGTQFLPRFVKQQEVPGEGMCYFYDDGSHCKNVIDGEAVNAHWGVTKAGKPRKRLAIACITCREKKIKCDPDYPKCIQCEKFGRVCKFKNAPRGASHGSPDASPTETDDFMDHDSNFPLDPQRFDADARKLEKVDVDNNYIKRRKNTFNGFTAVKADHEAHYGSTDGFRHLSSASESSLYFDTLLNTWYTDPYEANPALANQLLAAYFAHINSGHYRMFPEQLFMRWISSPSKKSLDDHMLIYTMLAMGTVFSSSTEHKERGRDFAKIGRYAAEHRSFSLQLVQTRLLLSLYYFATGDKDTSWDFCGGAMRAATGSKLNVEVNDTEHTNTEALSFGLSRHCYNECRRRTFWSLYIMDRFNSMCFGYLCVMNPDDIFLRLPCEPRSFEAQMENTNPYFDLSNTSTIFSKPNNLGSMSYLIIISSIWSDVMAKIYRTSYRPEQLSIGSNTAHMNFHNATTNRLEEWEASLTGHLQYSTVNLDRSMREDFFGTFLLMHALYYTTQIKLNRFCQSKDVSSSQLERNLRKAYTHAKTLLAIAKTLLEITTPKQQPHPCKIIGVPSEPQLSCQFMGYALVSALDIVSAKGKHSEIPELLKTLNEVKRVLNQLELFWHSARHGIRLVEKRIDTLEEVIGWNSERRMSEGTIPGVEVSSQGIWEMEESLEKTFGKSMDAVRLATWENWTSATDGL